MLCQIIVKSSQSIIIEVILKDMETLTRILIQSENKKWIVIKESLPTPNKIITINK